MTLMWWFALFLVVAGFLTGMVMLGLAADASAGVGVAEPDGESALPVGFACEPVHVRILHRPFDWQRDDPDLSAEPYDWARDARFLDAIRPYATGGFIPKGKLVGSDEIRQLPRHDPSTGRFVPVPHG